MDNKTIKGTIPALDIQYGNVWTNIPDTLFDRLKPAYGDLIAVRILYKNHEVYKENIPYANTFGAVSKGKPLAYINSLLQLSFALDQGDFAKTYQVASGGDWSVEVGLFKAR